MALAYDMMKGGVAAFQARGINGTANVTITAGTTQTQAGATALTASTNVITTVTVAGDGVVIPNSEVGDSINILNLGANAMEVYPPVGGRINQLSTNTGFTLAPSTACMLVKFSATRWMAFLSA
jgi:hypothetical protein